MNRKIIDYFRSHKINTFWGIGVNKRRASVNRTDENRHNRNSYQFESGGSLMSVIGIYAHVVEISFRDITKKMSYLQPGLHVIGT